MSDYFPSRTRRCSVRVKGIERERAEQFKEELEEEHPSLKGRIRIEGDDI